MGRAPKWAKLPGLQGQLFISIRFSIHYRWTNSCQPIRDPVRGFREPGEWGPKQPGSQEQDAKMITEQGADKINLGSMGHRVCHEIMVFCTVESFFASLRLAF